MTNTNSFGAFRNSGHVSIEVGRVESFEPSYPDPLPGATVETGAIVPTTSDPDTDCFMDGFSEIYDGAIRGQFLVVDPRRWPME